MPFIGNQPALSYTSFAKQDFTTSATTSYTLDNPVTNANELALFINFVRQEPTTAYSASGTSLTLTSATSASDDMYCVYLGKAVQTVNPPNASVGLSQLSATGTKDATTFLRGDNTFASAGGDNTPAFMAKVNASQSTSDLTYAKVNYASEVFDTNNAYDTSTSTFTVPSGEGGKYFIYANTRIDSGTDSEIYDLELRVNNSAVLINHANQYRYTTNSVAGTVNLSDGDTVNIYIFIQNNLSIRGDGTSSFFGGYKIIE